MCGRVTLALDIETVRDILRTEYIIRDTTIEPHEYKPRYNVSPGQSLMSIVNDGHENRVGNLHWGFVPSWAKDTKIGYKLINARAETLSEKPTFKTSFYKRRCIILVDGFFEWERVKNEKIPYRFVLKNRPLFSLAGLWTSYTKQDGSKLYSCTIITTEANSLMAKIHHRMPVILSPENEKVWLNPSIQDKPIIESVLTPYPPEQMTSYKVSSIVNNGKIDTPECIIPA